MGQRTISYIITEELARELEAIIRASPDPARTLPALGRDLMIFASVGRLPGTLAQRTLAVIFSACNDRGHSGEGADG